MRLNRKHTKLRPLLPAAFGWVEFITGGFSHNAPRYHEEMRAVIDDCRKSVGEKKVTWP